MTLLAQVQYTRVRSDRLWFARRGSSWLDFSLIDFSVYNSSQFTATTRHHVPTFATCSIISSQTPHPFRNFVPPIGLAMPKHEAKLKPRPGQRVSLMPLHLLCIQCTQLPQTWHCNLHLSYRQHMDHFK